MLRAAPTSGGLAFALSMTWLKFVVLVQKAHATTCLVECCVETPAQWRSACTAEMLEPTATREAHIYMEVV